LTQTKNKKTARDKLDLSSLRPDQLQGMGDVDLADAVLKIKNKVGLDVIGKLTDATMERTIEGASTLTLSIVDDDRAVLKSGRLKGKVDIEIDGLWFRLAKVRKQGKNLTLTFEDREIAILRTYFKKRIALRSQMTRAEFILQLIKEVKEFTIPYFIPELHVVQPIEKGTDLQTSPDATNVAAGAPGFPSNVNADRQTYPSPRSPEDTRSMSVYLTIKGKRATKTQLNVAAIILDTGLSMGARRKVLVAGMMTAIQESTMTNLKGGDGDSVGVFQQRPSWGSFEERHDVATAARMFFLKAIKADKQKPQLEMGQLCQTVQVSAFPGAYQQWHDEGDSLVKAYGVPGGDTTGTSNSYNNQGAPQQGTQPYVFYRGVPPQNKGAPWGHENSWHCFQRLAAEVNWRAFFVSGKFYYVDEDYLFKGKPLMVIDEDSPGVTEINGDLDQNKKSSQLDVPCEMKRWFAPPGSVVIVKNMGPYNGRWLVAQVSRSLFRTTGTVTLKKPLAQLPERPTRPGRMVAATHRRPAAEVQGRIRSRAASSVAVLEEPRAGAPDGGHDRGPLSHARYRLLRCAWVAGRRLRRKSDHQVFGARPERGTASGCWRTARLVDIRGRAGIEDDLLLHAP
jgi:hypothetical protein